MAKLTDIVNFLDQELRTSEIPDYGGAHNGLQLENQGEVTQIAVAVDASLAVVKDAVAAGADLLIVHHGLFWQGVQMMTGGYYQKIKAAIEGGLAIYSSHLPLDVHPEWGNNALLATELGLEVEEAILDWSGVSVGVAGEYRGSFDQLTEKIQKAVGPILASTGLEGSVGRLGIVTGGAGSEVEKVKAAGIDTFITGEGPHWSFPYADEIGLKVIYAGHYATETFGVKRLGDVVGDKFGLPFSFISRPTGL